VDSTWAYNLSIRVATDMASGGPFSVLVNGEERKTGIMVSNTGGWDQFITRVIGRIPLFTTDTLLRIRADQGNLNLGKMTFTYASSTQVPAWKTGPEALQLYPNPVETYLTLRGMKCESPYRIIDLTGTILMEGIAKDEQITLDIRQLQPGSYLVIAVHPGGRVQTARFVRLP